MSPERQQQITIAHEQMLKRGWGFSSDGNGFGDPSATFTFVGNYNNGIVAGIFNHKDCVRAVYYAIEKVEGEKKPICTGCNKHPEDIEEYSEIASEIDTSLDVYVRNEEGTYNPSNGHFLCTDCYIEAGMPATDSNEPGWICP